MGAFSICLELLWCSADTVTIMAAQGVFHNEILIYTNESLSRLTSPATELSHLIIRKLLIIKTDQQEETPTFDLHIFLMCNISFSHVHCSWLSEQLLICWMPEVGTFLFCFALRDVYRDLFQLRMDYEIFYVTYFLNNRKFYFSIESDYKIFWIMI